MSNESDPDPHSENVSLTAWQQRYREGRTGWDRGAPSPALIEWLESHPETRGHIVVPGCGYGHEVVELARRGWTVTGIDFAPIPVAALRDRLAAQQLTAEILCDDIFQSTLSQAADMVFEQTCLCAIDPRRRVEYEQCAARWLKPGGRLLACLMQTDRGAAGPPFHCDWNEMRQLFSDERWKWPLDGPRRMDHPSGLFELVVELERRTFS